jgi:hypothetical protein
MLSEPMSGAVAGQIGVAAFVVAEDLVESTAAQLAERLSAGPTRSYAAIRALLKAWAGGGVPGADALQLDVTMRLFETEDAQSIRLARKESQRTGKPADPVTFAGR